MADLCSKEVGVDVSGICCAGEGLELALQVYVLHLMQARSRSCSIKPYVSQSSQAV